LGRYAIGRVPFAEVFYAFSAAGYIQALRKKKMHLEGQYQTDSLVSKQQKLYKAQRPQTAARPDAAADGKKIRVEKIA